jgi:hypothetical protein
MAGDDIVKRLAIEQRKRLVASLLGAMETSPWWGKLGPTEQRGIREKVLTSIGNYHDFMLDIIKVGNDDGERNGYAIELIEAVHAGQRRLESKLNGRG